MRVTGRRMNRNLEEDTFHPNLSQNCEKEISLPQNCERGCEISLPQNCAEACEIYHIDGSWCTITEFLRISTWGQLSRRRLQQIIKENCLPYPVKKLYHSSKKFIYVIQLTDPNQLRVLRRLRQIQYARGKMPWLVKANSGFTIKKCRTVRVNMRSHDHVFIQSSEFLKSLYEYIRNTGEDIPIKKEKFGSIFINVPDDVYDKLSKVAQKGACSIGDALRLLILEFLKTPQGKAAAIFATKLSHPGLARDRINN